MPAASYDIVIEQGATFRRTLTIKDGAGVAIDLTGYQLRGQIRQGQSSASAIDSFTFTLANQGTYPGVVDMVLPYSDTTTIPVPTSEKAALKTINYLYDVEMQTPAGDVIRLLQGKVTVVPEITK